MILALSVKHILCYWWQELDNSYVLFYYWNATVYFFQTLCYCAGANYFLFYQMKIKFFTEIKMGLNAFSFFSGKILILASSGDLLEKNIMFLAH